MSTDDDAAAASSSTTTTASTAAPTLTPEQELAQFHEAVASGDQPLFGPEAFWSLIAGPDGPGEEEGLPFEITHALDQERHGGNGRFYDSAVSFAACRFNPKLVNEETEEVEYYDDLDCTSTLQQEFYTHDMADVCDARLRHYYVTNRLEVPTLIAEELKNNIYLCYKETGWPIERIAQYFRLKAMRIEAIIRLKQLQEQEEAESPSSDTFSRLYATTMPYIYQRQWKVLGKDGKIPFEHDDRWRSQPLSKFPSFHGLDEEIDQARVQQLLHPRPAVPDPQMPIEPPATKNNGTPRDDGVYFAEPYPAPRDGKRRIKNAATRAPLLFVDTSATTDRSDGLAVVRETDGRYRTATWEERRMAHYKPLPKKKRLPSDSARVDQIYYPVDDLEMEILTKQHEMREEKKRLKEQQQQ